MRCFHSILIKYVNLNKRPHPTKVYENAPVVTTQLPQVDSTYHRIFFFFSIKAWTTKACWPWTHKYTKLKYLIYLGFQSPTLKYGNIQQQTPILPSTAVALEDPHGWAKHANTRNQMPVKKHGVKPQNYKCIRDAPWLKQLITWYFSAKLPSSFPYCKYSWHNAFLVLFCSCHSMHYITNACEYLLNKNRIFSNTKDRQKKNDFMKQEAAINSILLSTLYRHSWSFSSLLELSANYRNIIADFGIEFIWCSLPSTWEI